MGKLETLTVDVPEDLAAAIRAAVERGEFESLSDAVTAALDDLLYDPGQETPEQTERLRRAVEEGIASGPSKYESIDEIIAEARRRFDIRRV